MRLFIDYDSFANILGYFTLMKVDNKPVCMWFSTTYGENTVFQGYGVLARRERLRRVYSVLRDTENYYIHVMGYKPIIQVFYLNGAARKFGKKEGQL